MQHSMWAADKNAKLEQELIGYAAFAMRGTFASTKREAPSKLAARSCAMLSGSVLDQMKLCCHIGHAVHEHALAAHLVLAKYAWCITSTA